MRDKITRWPRDLPAGVRSRTFTINQCIEEATTGERGGFRGTSGLVSEPSSRTGRVRKPILPQSKRARGRLARVMNAQFMHGDQGRRRSALLSSANPLFQLGPKF